MRVGTWWSLLARNGFRLSPSRIHLWLGVSFFNPFNDALGLLQWLRYGRQIRETKLVHDPIFILGHWRSGTTLMHELLVLDDQFGSPSTYACFAPWHFLLTEQLMVKYGSGLLPDKRPMDNMRTGWNLPQEDEFALMNLGAPTPYLRIAFPNNGSPWMNFIDMRDVRPEDREVWQNKLTWFVKALTLQQQRQLVLKSPPHTGRIADLLQLYPHAKFVHMVRDPRKLFPSTLRLWKSLEEIQGLQGSCSEQQLQDYVWECLVRMYAAFEANRQLIPENRIIDVRYEDLVAAPMKTVEQVYQHLELGDFEAARPKLQRRLAEDAEYRVNEHRIDAELERAVLQHWGDYARRYGYA